MDEAVRLSMDKWPNVPACFGWLSLNPRGQWLLGPEREIIHHRGLIDFIGRNYQPDAQGRWYCQNGPQQVFVTLDYAPWVFRLNGNGTLETHTGLALQAIHTAWLDDEGSLGFTTDLGPGTLDDRDLAPLLGHLCRQGHPLDDAGLEALLHMPPNPDHAVGEMAIQNAVIPLFRWSRNQVRQTLNFDPNPLG